MSEHRSDTALRALAELSVPEPVLHVEARERREVVEHLERMQRQTPKAASRRRWVWLSAAALVVSGLGIAVFVLSSAGPTAKDTAKGAVQPPPIVATGVERRITTGSEVKTDAGSSAQLRTSLGARISVGGSSELRLAEGQATGAVERVELASGSIRVKVPKLGPHRQFRVSTPDTLVIVHGTEFSVTVHRDAQGRPNTVVEVTSGRVEVRKKQVVEFLNAGAAWSSEQVSSEQVSSEQVVAPAPTSTPKPSSHETSTAKPSSAEAASPKAAPQPTERPTPSGNLVRANALLRSALEASRKGNDELALARLDELLRRYPDSPVADNAKVERFRVLKRLGRKREAARAASGYLEGDPDGFARDEARSLGK